MAADEKRFVQPREIQRGEGGAKRLMRFLRARGSAELGKVASGSTAQCYWLEDREWDLR